MGLGLFFDGCHFLGYLDRFRSFHVVESLMGSDPFHDFMDTFGGLFILIDPGFLCDIDLLFMALVNLSSSCLDLPERRRQKHGLTLFYD